MAEIKRYSLSKQVADKLESEIKEGKFKVGEKIPTEVVLVKNFGVGRNTIREAIKELASAGVLEVRQGDGTYVVSQNRFDANMSLKYQEVSFADLEEARNVLEVSIVHFAALRRTEEDLEALKEAFLKRKAATASKKEWGAQDIYFHWVIANATHNQILIDFYDSISKFLYENILMKTDEKTYDEAYADSLHEDLYEAILNQDPNGAREAIIKIIEL